MELVLSYSSHVSGFRYSFRVSPVSSARPPPRCRRTARTYQVHSLVHFPSQTAAQLASGQGECGGTSGELPNNIYSSLPHSTPSLQYFERIKCPYTNCVVTSNRTYLNNLSDYDMIGFNSWNVHSLEDFPPPETRRPEQIYFLYYHESPTRTKEPLKEYSQFFNWTMSFR